MKKIISLLLAMSMMFSMVAFADDTEEVESYDDEIMLIEEEETEEETLSDLELAYIELGDHWSKDYITYMNEKDVILPTNASFTPDTAIYRVEFMRYINRAFNFNDTASISYNDVEVGSWYYDDVAKAVYQGYIEGTGSGNMNPGGYLTRQEAVVIMSRLHNVEASNTDNLNFTDAEDIADWAAPYISFAVDAGYVAGRTDGSFDPLGYITRAEIAKIIYYFGGTLLESGMNGSYDIEDDHKNVTITQAGTTLEDTTVEGNLYISQGVNGGTVTLDNVTVLGELIISGGDVTLEDVTVDTLIIKSPQDEKVTVELEGDCQILDTHIYSQAELSGEGFLNVIEKMETLGTSLSLEGTFRDVVLTTNVVLDIVDSEITQLYVSDTAKSAEMTLLDTDIETGTFNAACELTGTDSFIYELYLNASNIEIIAEYKIYYTATGSSALLNGTYVYGNSSNTVATSDFYFDFDEEVGNITTTISLDEDDILRVVHGSTQLVSGEDYKISSSILTIYSSVFEGISGVDTTITIVPATGDDIYINIYFVDLSQNSLSSYEYDFDKYYDTSDLEILLSASSDKTVTGITYGGYYSLSSSEYYVSGSKIYISASYLKTLSTGTASFEVKMSGLNNPKFIVNISNSVSANTVSPEEFTFDTNIASVDYSDITVLLTESQGFFEGLYHDGTQLVENTDYVVNGDYITIRREYIVNLDSTADITFEFEMSLGNSPTLDVSVVATNPVVAIFVDENGLPVEGVTATCQDVTVTSDKNGKAYFNLAHGNKTIYYEKSGYESDYSTFYTSSNITEKTYVLYLD